MDDTDVIARIYTRPGTNYEVATFDTLQASKHYLPPVQQPLPPYNARETTPPPSVKKPVKSCAGKCVELRFSRPPASPAGFIFGRNNLCDVMVPNLNGISHVHCSITFDENRRLIVRDLGSKCGTRVTYNGVGESVRRDFVWIIGGDEMIDGSVIVVTLGDQVEYLIDVIRHDSKSQHFMSRADTYRKGQAQPQDSVENSQSLIENLVLLSRINTERPTSTHTPATGDIYLEKVLDSGSFGVVTRYWNVTTGHRHVVKKPLDSLPHIVQFLGAEYDPHPQIAFEYIAGGSLKQHLADISPVQSWMILLQSLSALTYLHELDPPIAHRDIKPANMLVHKRGKDFIHIKFADFGLSKHGDDLVTFCGSLAYTAPELYANRNFYVARGGTKQLKYTTSADIWSLGVVVFQLACCALPPWKDELETSGTKWCEAIWREFWKHQKNNPSTIGEFLLAKMVRLPYDDRATARECWEEAWRLAPAEIKGQAPFNTSIPSEQPSIDRHNYTTPGVGQETVVPGRHCPVETVTPLTALPDLPARERNDLVPRRQRPTTPAEYAHINGHEVPHRPSERLIQAAALMKAYGVSLESLRRFQHRNPNDVPAICAHFKMDVTKIFRALPAAKQLQKRVGVAPSHAEAVPPSAPALSPEKDASGVTVGPSDAFAPVSSEQNTQQCGRPRGDAAGSSFEFAYQIGSYPAPAGRSHGEFLGGMELSHRIDDNYREGISDCRNLNSKYAFDSEFK